MGNARAIQENVLQAVAEAGALTVRRVVQEHGMQPNWYRLIERGHLVQLRTVYGTVLVVGGATRRSLIREGQNAPYIAAPSTAADCAYHNDARQVLEKEGYTYEFAYCKAASGMTPGRRFTDVITRTVLRVPDRMAARMHAVYCSVRAPKFDQYGVLPEVLGYPSLYASISNGGLTTDKVRRLYRWHHFHIHEWRHPLLLAVPDPEPHLNFIRALEARQRRASVNLPREYFSYDLIRLVTVPLPER